MFLETMTFKDNFEVMLINIVTKNEKARFKIEDGKFKDKESQKGLTFSLYFEALHTLLIFIFLCS